VIEVRFGSGYVKEPLPSALPLECRVKAWAAVRPHVSFWRIGDLRFRQLLAQSELGAPLALLYIAQQNTQATVVDKSI
jgi:hypothetical protein